MGCRKSNFECWTTDRSLMGRQEALNTVAKNRKFTAALFSTRLDWHLEVVINFIYEYGYQLDDTTNDGRSKCKTGVRAKVPLMKVGMKNSFNGLKLGRWTGRRHSTLFVMLNDAEWE